MLTEESAELLREYVDDFRPHGPHPETRWLFPNRDSPGRARASQGFSSAIVQELKRSMGVDMTVQAFRCFVATLIMETNPHAIEDVRPLLGHAGFAMAERHYRRSNRRGAALRLSDSLKSQRRATKLQAAAATFRPPRAERRGTRGGVRS